MRIEDLLEASLNNQQETKGAATPEQEAEIAQLVKLTRQLSQVEPVPMRPQARQRIAARLAQAAAESKAGPETTSSAALDATPAPTETRLFRQLANRLGVSIDEMCRYISPKGATLVGRFLGVPGYSAMFDLLGILLRALRRLESLGSTL